MNHYKAWFLVEILVIVLLVWARKTRCGKQLKVESGPVLQGSSKCSEITCKTVPMGALPQMYHSELPFIQLDHMTTAVYAANIPLPASPPLPPTLIGTTIAETSTLPAFFTLTEISGTLVGTPVTADSEVKDETRDETEDWITEDVDEKMQKTEIGDVERSLPPTLASTTVPVTLIHPEAPTISIFSEISYVTPVTFSMTECEVEDDSEDEMQDSNTEDEDDEIQETATRDVEAELQKTQHHEIEIEGQDDHIEILDVEKEEKCEENVEAESLETHKDEVEPAQQADCTDNTEAEPREIPNSATTVTVQADCMNQVDAEPHKTPTHDTKAEMFIYATKKVEAEPLQEPTQYLEPGASRKRTHHKAFTRRVEADIPKDLDNRLFFWEGRYTETEYTGPWCTDWQKWEDEPLPQELAPGEYFQPEIKPGIRCGYVRARRTSPYSLLEQDLFDSSYATRMDFPVSKATTMATIPVPDAVIDVDSTPMATKTAKLKELEETHKNLEKNLKKREMDLKMSQIENFCLQKDREVREMHNATKAKKFVRGKRS